MDRRDLLAVLVVAASAAGLLWATGSYYGLERIWVTNYLNDQVGYVTTSRWLAETGELRSHILYPAYVEDPRWRLYMPGHYWAMAASFLAFGYGALQARLPCLAAYVLGSVSVYAIGRRLYRHEVGLVAALLFVVFPMHGYYAFSAMADMTVTGAAAAGFAAFVLAPERARPFVLPFALAIPFLFRETTALLVLPGAFLALRAGRGGVPGFLVAGVGSVVVLGLVNAWQLAAGKGSTPLSWVTLGRFNYGDALAAEASPPSFGELTAGIARNLGANADLWWQRVSTTAFDSILPGSTIAIFALALLALVLGLRRRDPFAVGTALFALLSFALVFALYNVSGFRLLRSTLVAYPFLAVAVVGVLLPAREGPWRLTRALPAFAVLALALGFPGFRAASGEFVHDPREDEIDAVARIGHDDTRVLVGPTRLTLPYVLRRYPVRFSFVPDNEETLIRLCRAHDVETLILPKELVGTTFSHVALRRLGFTRDEQTDSERYAILRNFRPREVGRDSR